MLDLENSRAPLVCLNRRMYLFPETTPIRTQGSVGWEGCNADPSFNIERGNALIQARIRSRRDEKTRPKDTYETREKFARLYLIDF
jgi:hypothetical protein